MTVLEDEALSTAAMLARLAAAYRSPCTPGCSWRSLLSHLLIVTARAIPSGGLSDKANSLLRRGARLRIGRSGRFPNWATGSLAAIKKLIPAWVPVFPAVPAGLGSL